MPRPPGIYSASRHHAMLQTRRFFTLPIPGVDSTTFAAVQSFIRKRQPGLVHRAAWDQARYKSEKIEDDVQDLEERLVELKEEKDEAVKDVTDARDEQLDRTVMKAERKLRMEHEREQKDKDEDVSKEVKATIEKQRKKNALEQESQRKKNEEEPPIKRQKLNSDEEKVQAAQDGEDDSDDLEEGELTEGAESKTDGPAGEEVTSMDIEAEPPRESETKKEELKDVRSKVDHIKETKSEIVWLLRQVITAEKKKKDQVNKTKNN